MKKISTPFLVVVVAFAVYGALSVYLDQLNAVQEAWALSNSHLALLTGDEQGGDRLLLKKPRGGSGGGTPSSPLLSVARNAAFGDPTYARGALNAKIGSYTFTASAVEGINIASVSMRMGMPLPGMQNLKVRVGGAQVGITQSAVTAGGAYTFLGTVNIPAGQTKAFDVYADILSSASGGIYSAVTTLAGCAATGSTSGTAASCPQVTGQGVVIASTPALNVDRDSATPPSDFLAMGSAENSLVVFRFTETENQENIRITDLNVVQQVRDTLATKSGFTALKLYQGGVLAGTAGAPTASVSGNAYVYHFSFASPIIVPQANAISLVLKGDVASYSSSGATDNTTHIFKIGTTPDALNDTPQEAITAFGATSNAVANISFFSPSGFAMRILRTVLGFSALPIGVQSGRVKTVADDFATLTFSANPAGSLALNRVIASFSGTALGSATSTALSFANAASLIDENGVSIGFSTSTGSCVFISATSTLCTKTFNLGSGTSGQVVSAGTSRTWKLRVDSTKTAPAQPNVAQTLQAFISGSTDVLWTDALEFGAASGLPLSPKMITPINLNSVTYTVGT